ncbi:hypothetical protein HYH03_007013 [Edaphochlamys debaryana]|uniref:Glycosyl transferase CAP10 domain-containing protein n=1 Tax=Edaphochlamys debaryana TaxID=47281 RepID=A0A835Y4V7_9CHLO|nr:hypothetical protein HYH03_007013 [Edaphochlamys debaryana]|eukprot:KAG2494768.1 hypothetical protein HYH03_007013 [Edaphochlamys debaryana]
MLPEATTEEDLAELFQRSLEPDLQPWRERAPLNRSHIDAFVWRWSTYDLHRQSMIVIYKNRWYYPFHYNWNHTQTKPFEMQGGIHPWLGATQWYFQKLTQEEGWEFPDTFFFYSDWDVGWCYNLKACPMPALALSKESITGRYDILVPMMSKNDLPLYDYPWALKENKAFFVGRANWRHSPKVFRAENGTNVTYFSRLHMAQMSLKHPDKIHAALIGKVPNMDSPNARITYAEAPLPDHARWKFVMNLDGVTYAFRLGRLMHTNSVVLKEETSWPEYYVRAMEPGVHYLPIFKTGPDDVLDVLAQYSDPSRDRELRRIAYNAQQFAVRYLRPRPRMLYFRRVLKEFKKLFDQPDGTNANQAFLEKTLVPILEARARGDMNTTYMDMVPFIPKGWVTCNGTDGKALKLGNCNTGT